MMEHTAKGGLSRNQLKYIAILAMIIDHVAWTFVPLLSWQGQAMHFVGRFTGPAMAFFIAQGYLHTRDMEKYVLRLGGFALVSWPAYSCFATGRPFSATFGVIYTLLLGLLAAWIWDGAPVHAGVRLAAVAALIYLSTWGDWAWWGVLWPLAAVALKDRPGLMWRVFTGLCALAAAWCIWRFLQRGWPWWAGLYNLGLLAPPVLLRRCYNGRGGSRHPFHKWFFYGFYPAHLLALAALRWR